MKISHDKQFFNFYDNNSDKWKYLVAVHIVNKNNKKIDVKFECNTISPMSFSNQNIQNSVIKYIMSFLEENNITYNSKFSYDKYLRYVNVTFAKQLYVLFCLKFKENKNIIFI